MANIRFGVKKFKYESETSFIQFCNETYNTYKELEGTVITCKNLKYNVIKVKKKKNPNILILSVEKLVENNIPYIAKVNEGTRGTTDIKISEEEYIAPRSTNFIFILQTNIILAQTGKDTISMKTIEKNLCPEFDFEILPILSSDELNRLSGKKVKSVRVVATNECFTNIFSLDSETSEVVNAKVDLKFHVDKKSSGFLGDAVNKVGEMYSTGSVSKCEITCIENDKLHKYFISEVQESEEFYIETPRGTSIKESAIINKMLELI